MKKKRRISKKFRSLLSDVGKTANVRIKNGVAPRQAWKTAWGSAKARSGYDFVSPKKTRKYVYQGKTLKNIEDHGPVAGEYRYVGKKTTYKTRREALNSFRVPVSSVRKYRS